MFMQFTVSVLIDLFIVRIIFFTSYQQKETGEITINQSRIKFSKTRTTTNQTCGNVKKEPS
jgi:hypothetical protein